MTSTTDIIKLCRERAEAYGALRKSSITAIALDKAADRLAELSKFAGEGVDADAAIFISEEAFTAGFTVGVEQGLMGGEPGTKPVTAYEAWSAWEPSEAAKELTR